MSQPNKSNSRTYAQYRLTWLREGLSEKSKKFNSMKTVERQIRILTSYEPWREWAPEKEPDDYACCPGGQAYECGCGGETVAEQATKQRETLPKILWIRLDERFVTQTSWQERLIEESKS